MSSCLSFEKNKINLVCFECSLEYKKLQIMSEVYRQECKILPTAWYLNNILTLFMLYRYFKISHIFTTRWFAKHCHSNFSINNKFIQIRIFIIFKYTTYKVRIFKNVVFKSFTNYSLYRYKLFFFPIKKHPFLL